LTSRRELALAVSARYSAASKTEKTKILDEFVQSSGLNRKYAISVLRRPDRRGSSWAPVFPRRRRRKYGLDVQVPFLLVWRVSGGLCPKRLIPFLPELLSILERFDEIDVCPNVRERLLMMSISTAERMLGRVLRAHARGISTTLPGTLLRNQISIRTFEEWTECKPGFMEIDLVAHCGGTSSGDFAYTLTMTDIHTGWTELIGLTNRSQITVEAGIEIVRKRLPFILLGIDSDNGAEFINHGLKRYCDSHSITFTRCRPYKKNDQCHVEQKNGALVRPLVGYARYEGLAAVAYLNRLYAKHRISVNFFSPSMKLVSKSRTGSRVKKTYDEAKTPWQRLKDAQVLCVDDPNRTLAPEDEARLTREYEATNPAKLRRDIEELEMGLRRFSVDDPIALVAPSAGCADSTAVPGSICAVSGATCTVCALGGDPLG
jgi:hypothetical protein